MKIKVQITADIPSEILSPGYCRRFGAPKGEPEYCPYINFFSGRCVLFDEAIPEYKKCEPCAEALMLSARNRFARLFPQ